MYYYLNLYLGDIFLIDIIIYQLKIEQNTKSHTLGTELFYFQITIEQRINKRTTFFKKNSF